MKRYIKMEFYGENDEDLEIILGYMRTTLPDNASIVTEEGDYFIEILSDQELLNESLLLGRIFATIELQAGIENPFDVEVVELAEAPVEGA